MSIPNPSVMQDDDGPEEGEIEDDEEDDIILLDGSSPHRSSTTSTSLDVYPLPARKECYERDIRHFELHRSRTTRRRTSGATKRTHSTSSSIRTKTRNSRTGLTEGKENRHVHRYTSPPRIRHRRESNENALADFKDVSPLRRDSSCSSVESDERWTDRVPYSRSTRKAPSKTERLKRKSSSSPESYIPSKRRSHHSEKCPLMKVLHSVAKETRLIALENSESHTESSSLRQRLLNMGAMPAIHEEVHAKDKNDSIIVISDSEDVDSHEKKLSLKNNLCEGLDSSEQNLLLKNNLCNSIDTRDQSPPASDTLLSVPLKPEENNTTVNSENDEEDDISQLRLLALQSKKHEPSPPEDADVLQLRLAALKTAFIKKLKIRKKICIKINSRSSKEDPLSPLDEIPMPFSVPSPDEVMTPVDMELAETDDEDASVDSVVHYSPSDPMPDCYSPSDPIPDGFSSPIPYPECYSPSDPTGSPTLESSLQDLLPPPPPPDLDLLYGDQPVDTSFQGNVYHSGNTFLNTGYEQSPDVLALPPLPPYFQQLLSEPPEQSMDIYNTEPQSPISAVDADCSTLGVPSIKISPNLIEIPVVPDVVLESFETVPPINCKEMDAGSKEEEKHMPVVDSLPDSKPSCNLNESQGTGSKDEASLSAPVIISLEEEEKMLRQRLLLNMAKKRENLPKQKKQELKSADGISQSLPNTVLNEKVQANIQLPKKAVMKTSISKAMAVNTESLKKRRSTTPVAILPAPSVDKKFIVNLGEDSDSCEDYSEAEALGQKCSENMEKWQLHLKELEINPPKMLTPGSKVTPTVRGKVPSRTTIKGKHPISQINGKKPFAENLADLETSVERFLKGVRNSQEAISKSKSSLGIKSAPSNGTPVAVKHLPASQQEEYRRLKQQIATLEKQRQVSIEKKRALQSVSKGTQMNTLTNQKITKLTDKGSGKAVPSLISRSTVTLEASGTKMAPKTGTALKQPVSTSLKIVKATAPQILPKSPKVTAPETSSETLAVTVTQTSPQPENIKVQRDIPVLKGKTALANVSNLSVASLPNLSKTAPEIQKNNKSNKLVASNSPSLSSLEENLIIERSHVLNELSALAKLLSQVDKSLEAQSQTAGEVSNLIDKLCLAAGRWKAQNVTVTDLVQKVAQRQKELSLRHRRCVALSKSCSELGTEQIGKNYRSPGDKAVAMHVQLKQVHEKTQDLARRKAAERSRRNVLEKRAEDCLIKLFSDASAETLEISNQAPAPAPASKAPARKPQLARGTNQQAPVGSVTNSTSASAQSSSGHGKTMLTVNYSHQVNPALISKAISLRLALNKVRYAKATLNLAKKHSFERKLRLKSKKKNLNSEVLSLDVRQELSDMDISTDGEETEKRNKHSTENTEVVDMLVSPGSSLGPPEADPVNTQSEGGAETVEQNGRCNENIAGFEYFCDNIFVDAIGTKSKGDLSSVAKETAIGNNKPLMTSRNVLKDYVSPLSGLNVRSSGSSKEKCREGDLDPYAILCPYDLNGKCEDLDCQFKHQHR